MTIQLILVILIASGAVFFLVRRIYNTMAGKKKEGCADCGTVTSSKAKAGN